MSTSDTRPATNREFAYLCVDDFLSTLLDAQALQTAFELGLIDALRTGARALEELEKAIAGDRRGLHLLLDLLRANQVVGREDQEVCLTAPFLDALQYRDLLEAKMDFARLVTPDALDSFNLFITDPGEFMRQARLFDLFDYRRCNEPTPQNYERTRKWMRLTTCLTRYDGLVCTRYHDFSPYRRMLDIGGNSGEFALQLCKRFPNLEATVFDLPVVCDLGSEHVASHPEASRIQFMRGSALTDTLPGGFDLVTFKSMLHDWPDADAKRLLTRASNALAPGGTLLIFERGPIHVDRTTCRYAMMPMLLFFRSFRGPTLYQEQLHLVGLKEIRTREIQLEIPFYLVTARLVKT